MTALNPTATHSGAGEMKAEFGQWHHFVFNFTILFILYTLHAYFCKNTNTWACTLIITVSVLSRKHPATQRPGCGHPQHQGPIKALAAPTASVLAAPTAAPGAAGGPWRPRVGPCRSDCSARCPTRAPCTTPGEAENPIEQWECLPGIPNWLCFQGGWSSSCESHFLICCLLKQTVAYLLSRHILWQHIMGAFLSNPQGLSKYKQITEALTPIPHHARDITVIF